MLNGGFSGTFTKAQQEFIRLGAEIKNLQAIQRDVKAYEKQAAAVQNTSGKLENLRRQYELVNRQISEAKGSTAALEREKLKLEQSSTRPVLEVVAGGQTSSGTKMEMHFHIEAGAQPETVNAWQDYVSRGELKSTVLEIMEDADADTRRRAMA